MLETDGGKWTGPVLGGFSSSSNKLLIQKETRAAAANQRASTAASANQEALQPANRKLDDKLLDSRTRRRSSEPRRSGTEQLSESRTFSPLVLRVWSFSISASADAQRGSGSAQRRGSSPRGTFCVRFHRNRPKPDPFSTHRTVTPVLEDQSPADPSLLLRTKIGSELCRTLTVMIQPRVLVSWTQADLRTGP